jgi:hypothetical protein
VNAHVHVVRFKKTSFIFFYLDVLTQPVKIKFNVAESGRQAEARKSSYQYMVETSNEEPWQPCAVQSALARVDLQSNSTDATPNVAAKEHAAMQEIWFPASSANRGTWMRPAAVHQVARRLFCFVLFCFGFFWFGLVCLVWFVFFCADCSWLNAVGSTFV